ncbi:hypothetical protein ACS0TY_020852 [Phlomoides rotata]
MLTQRAMTRRDGKRSEAYPATFSSNFHSQGKEIQGMRFQKIERTSRRKQQSNVSL